MGSHETAARAQERLSRGHYAALAVLLAVIAGLVAVACAELAAGHVLTGVTALASAALGGAAALLLELNRALLQLNRVLINQNARLLWQISHAGDDTVTFERRDSRQ